MKRLMATIRFTLVLLAGLLAGASSTFATVTIVGTSGGGNISADTASNGPAPAWTTLGPITITEGTSTDFTNGAGVSLVLRAPPGFQFNTAVTPNVTFTAGRNITSASAAVTVSSNITVTLTVSGSAVATDSLTIGSTTRIQVRPTAVTPLATDDHIYRPSTGGGTAGIRGITTSVDGSTGSDFGDLTEAPGTPSSTMPSQAQILSDMTLANNYFTNNWPAPGCSSCLPGGRPTTIWTRAAYFEGSLALWRINHDPAITNYAFGWGNFHNWILRNGAIDTSSDNQCAGAEFIELYQLDTTKANRITNIVANLNYWMFTNSTKVDWWWYIDGVHMSMPAFAKMAAISGSTNANYASKMYSYWHYTSNALYKVTDHLWCRDSNYLTGYRASDGTTQKCYWSRGNGWVFAGLARTLDVLPTNDVHYGAYLQTFQQMATALKPIQRSDGFWNMNLGYTNDYPGPESSGTAMFTYGLAWGIHHGYLNSATYLPTVIKGWNALSTSALHHSPSTDPGFIGFVQSTGESPTNNPPVKYTADPDFDDYTLGTLLLAGSEVYQLASLSQTITFGSIPNHTYGDAPFSLNATASSGLPVSFSIVSGPATLASNILTITGAGNVTVQASQAGNGTYGPATNVNQSFTVSPAVLRVSADNKTAIYGGGIPTLTVSYSGFVNGDTAAVLGGNPSLTTVATGLSPVGPYTITAAAGNLSAANYSFTFTAGTLTISPRSLTVTANPAGKTYGEILGFAGTEFTSSGLVNGDSIAQVALTSAGSSATAPAASYSIVPSGAAGTGMSNYTIVYVNGTLTVNRRPISVRAVADSKTYDNNTSSAGIPTITGGPVNGDLSGFTQTFDTKNVGTGKTLMPAGAMSDGNGGNNYIVTFGTANGVITPASLTVTGIGATSKVYDGTTVAALSGTPVLTGIVGGETVTLGGAPSASFGDKAVADNKQVTVTGYMVNGADAANYTLAQPTNLTANITPRNLTVTGITANNKAYDGSTTAALNVASATLNGVISGDTVTLGTSAASGTFSDATVESGKTVYVSGLTIAGADAANYELTQPTATADITAAGLTVTGITADSKVYDATTNATLVVSNAALVGILSGDDVTLVSSNAIGAYLDKNAGTGKTVLVVGLTLSGLDAAKYVLIQPTTTADITAAGLTVSGVTANDKVYEGTLVATLNIAGAVLQGVLGDDRVTLSVAGASGSFADAMAGQGKTVYVSGLTVSGSDAGNYSLAQPTTTANITQTGLTVTGITANAKVYDGTTAATLNLGSATLQGVVSGDIVILNYGSAAGAFANKNVGNDKTVAVIGLTLGGRDGGNYTLTEPTTTANITALGVSVAGLTASNKVYDRTTAAALSGTPTLSGVVSGDTVTLGGTALANFGDKTAANNKPVTVAGYTISGTDAGNYTLAQPAGLTANITPFGLTVTGIIANNKPYDGTTTATLNLSGATLNGTISGDTVTLTTAGTTGAFSDASVGQGKTVTISGLSVSGADAGNYFLTQPTTTASITAVLDHFLVTVSGPQTAGIPFDISITAQDLNNDILTDFNGTVDLTTTAGTIRPTNTAVFAAGVLSLQSVTVTGAGSGKTITAADHAGSGKTGTSGGFTVNPGALSPANSTISPSTASRPADGVSTQVITVQARDLYNNNLPSGGAVVVFSNSGGGTLTGTTDHGDGTYTAVLTSPLITGSVTVSATIGLTQVGTSVGTGYSVVTFTAGAAVSANSTISPATATKPADGTSTLVLTVQARDSHTNNLTIGGDTVVIFKQSGAGTVSATTDNGDGTYSATLTSPTTTGRTTLGATLGGTTIGTTVGASSSVITLVPGPVSAARSIVTANPTNNVTADGSAFSTITVAVKDAYDNPIPGQTVVFSVIGHSDALTAPAPTDTNGLTTARMTSTVPEPKTISARVGATNITQQAHVTFVAGTVNAFSSSVSVNPSSNVTADGTAFSTITVTLLDPNYNPVPGQTVTLTVSGTGNTVSTPPLSDANGQTTATLVSTNAGTKTVSARAGAITIAQQPTVTFAPAPVSAAHSTLTASPTNNVLADGSAFSTITVTVRDAADNPVAGQTVGLSVAGRSYTLTTPALTDANGRTTARLSSTVAETKIVTASVAGSNITQQVQIAFVAGTVNAANSTVSVSPNNNITANGAAAATVTVALMDANSNPVPGQTVTLSVSGTGNAISTPAVTDINGQTAATITSTNVGIKSVTASVGTTTIAQQPTVTFVPGPATQLVFVSQPGSATYGASLSPQPSVKTKDAFGNDSAVGLGSSKLVSLAVSAGTDSLQGVTALDIGASAGNGIASFTGLKVTGTGTGKQLTASAPGLTSATSAAFGIDAATLTVTAHDQSRAYGASNPEFTAGYSGFVNGDSSGVLNGTLSFSCLDTNGVSVDTNTPVGSYPILASGQSAANYNLTYINGTLTVTQAVLTVSADNLQRVYGMPNPILTASYSGFANGENTNVLSGGPSLTTATDINSPADAYPIQISLGTLSTNDNYSFTFTNGTLTVAAANSIATLVSSINPSPFGSNVTFTATLAPVSPGIGTPSGSVQFLANGVAFGGTVTLSGGIAAVSTTLLPSGSNTVTVAYAGDGNFLGAGASLVQVVSLDVQPPSTLSIKLNNDGTATATFQGTPGAQYVVQANINLAMPAGWVNVSTNTAGLDGTWTFIESRVGYSQRYFRAAKP